MSINKSWAWVRGYEGLYMVSDAGDVMSIPKNGKNGIELSQTSDSKGYMRVGLYKDGRESSCQVHRLVAEAFLDNPKGYNEIDHRNHNRLDNRAENLRWCTHSENMSNSNKPKVKSCWKNITAEDISSGEIYEFSRFRDIVPFSLSRGWGNGWGTAIRRKLENGGTAYGFYWSAKNKEVITL